MKKIYALFIMIAVAFTLSACGPNSDYYNLGSKNIYYYNDQPLVVNPYNLLYSTLSDNEVLKQVKPSVRKALSEYYDIEVEYRKVGEKAYKNMSHEENNDFAHINNNMIYSDEPGKTVGNGLKYEFKIHFIDKETKSEKTMLNLFGTFSFLKSPANAFKQVVKVSLGETYNVLKNVEQYNSDGNLVNLKDLYSIGYQVKLGDVDVTVSDDGDVIFDQIGTYDITITLTQLSGDEGEADAESSASQTGGSDTMVLTIVYSILVE